MRRFVLMSMLSLAWVMAAPGLHATHAGEAPSGPTVELRRIWVVAGGAAAEARYRVTCDPGPFFFSSGVAQHGVAVAGGGIAMFPCTGSPETVVVTLQGGPGSAPAPVRTGPAEVSYGLFNCVDFIDPCVDLHGQTPATVVTGAFVTPYDADYSAELTLVRSRLRSDGTVGVVYDLTCSRPTQTESPMTTTLTQVTRRGGLRVGTGQPTWPDNYILRCDPDGYRIYVDGEVTDAGRRFRTVVTPTSGRFRAGTSFIDTHVGSRYDDSTYAADQHPLNLRR